VLSTNTKYKGWQDIIRDDGEGNHWYYYFDPSRPEIILEPGEVFSFTVGGYISVFGRTADAYVGDTITVTHEPIDSFGSFLTEIYTATADHSRSGTVYPQIQLTDPNGSDIFLEYWMYHIPVTAPTGSYDMSFEWNTGAPYQGLITADSQFMVLPQQTSAVIPLNGGTLYSSWDDTLYEFAPDTFSESVIITHTVVYTGFPDYVPMLGIEHFYDVTAVYVSSGLPAQPTQPYTVTIGYADGQRGVVIENSLGLYGWDGGQWLREPTSLVDPINNLLIARPDHFSTWGILGETNRSFLALINR